MVPVEEPQKYGEVVGVVTEQPAPASGVVVGVLTEQPGASEGLGGRGSLEFLGRWNRNRAMPTKLKAERDTETMVRVGFGKLVDELVQNGASSDANGIAQSHAAARSVGPPCLSASTVHCSMSSSHSRVEIWPWP